MKVVKSDTEYAEVTCLYDDHNKVLETAYYDPQGEPAHRPKSKYVRWISMRDEDGNIIFQRYFRENNVAHELRKRVGVIVRTFDENNRVISEAYYHLDGTPANFKKKQKYSKVVYSYDKNGNKIRQSYFGRDGRPCVPVPTNKGILGRATTLWEYNDDNKLLSERYYDENGNPVVTMAGYAGITHEWNEDYTEEMVTYIAPDGGPRKPTYKAQTYVKVRKTYDENGLLLREEYLDENGKPTPDRRDRYGMGYEYDELGRKIKQYYFGKKGQITGGRMGYAYSIYTYKKNGKVRTENYNRYGFLIK